MLVRGTEVTEKIDGAVVQRMMACPFQSMDLANVVGGMPGIPNMETAHRIADRIIQRESKKGNIKITKRPMWHWVAK